MEFTVKTGELATALGIVKGTFGNKNLPALNNIYFDAAMNGDVTVKASNGHETTTTLFSAHVLTPGTVLIDGYTMSKIVATFADGDVTIRQQSGMHHVDITHPTGELEVVGEDPLNFLNPAEITEKSSFMIPSKEFKEGLESVAFARASKDSNAMLNGVAIIVDGGKTFLYASDRTRIAKYQFDTPAAADINVVIGAESIKALNSVTGNIAVRISDSGFLFETNDTSYQGTIMTTNYPDKIGSYFALPEYASFVAERAVLEDMLRRVSILSKAGKDEPHANFEFHDSGELEIVFTGTRGKIKSEKMQTTHNGPSVSLRLPVDKILESVSKITKDRVEFVFPQGKHPIPTSVNIYPEGTHEFGVFNMSVSS